MTDDKKATIEFDAKQYQALVNLVVMLAVDKLANIPVQVRKNRRLVAAGKRAGTVTDEDANRSRELFVDQADALGTELRLLLADETFAEIDELVAAVRTEAQE